MNGKGFHSSMLQQQVMVDESNPKLWSKSNSRPPPGHGFSDLLRQPPSVSSTDTTVFPHYPSQPSDIVVPVASLPDSHDLPADSWSQLLLGGIVGEEEKYETSLLQPRNTDNREAERQAKNSPLFSAPMVADHVSRYFHSHGSEEEEAEGIFPWRQLLPAAAAASSPRSSTTSVCSSMLDFSIKNKRHHPETQCNSTSTGEAHKKSKASSEPCAFKVRKEKLGDRITALHQLVSPFGKTDTASVLLEAIGYIRFLQSQVEALSRPYLGCGSGNKRQPSEDDEKMSNNYEQPKKKKKDLRSRGLCLVPVSFTLHVGNGHGHGGFR